MADKITQERLKEVIYYNKVTGDLTWIKPTSNRIKAGHIAKVNAGRCVSVSIDGKSYLGHHLAWLYEYGTWPINEIDHKDGVPYHNWIDNLRDVPHAINMQNLHSSKGNSKTGVLGVSYRRGKYRACIYINKRNIHLGDFINIEDAKNAYLFAKEALHEGYFILGL